MEKGMLLSTDMVRATLDGRKKMTRRMNGLNKINELPEEWTLESFDKNQKGTLIATFLWRGNQKIRREIRCPWEPGDILWFRETWTEIDGEIFYRADGYPEIELRDRFEQPKNKKVKWKPSLFMPRSAARLFGDIQNIRIERLHDITASDIIAEGTPYDREIYEMPCNIENAGDTYLRGCFLRLWDGINAQRGYGWRVNPWVWVIEYEEAEDYA